MNTTYFLNLVSGNVFGSKKTPALPEKYYLGLSSAAPALDGSGVVEPGEGCRLCSCRADFFERPC